MFLRKKPWITTAHRGYATGEVLQNTLEAFKNAADKGADMIETDARMTVDGILVVSHDSTVKGYDKNGEFRELEVSKSTLEEIKNLCLVQNGTDRHRVPTVEEVLRLLYYNNMCANIDMKEGSTHAEDIARLVKKCGMAGRTVYGTNGSGAKAINTILALDPEAKFIDTKKNFTYENLKEVKNFPEKCYVYTSDFSEQNISEIRQSGCKLATVSLDEISAPKAFEFCPDMMEYEYSSDFETIEKNLISAK